MKKITTQKQAKKLKFGEQYIIDVFPVDPDKVTEAQVAKAAKITEIANDGKEVSVAKVKK